MEALRQHLADHPDAHLERRPDVGCADDPGVPSRGHSGRRNVDQGPVHDICRDQCQVLGVHGDRLSYAEGHAHDAAADDGAEAKPVGPEADPHADESAADLLPRPALPGLPLS
jgi:hypothetical protein